jgi:NSS family neurotransmitter:Na+ symporter
VTVAVAAPRFRWRSRTTFVLAMSASVVGLGNLWRFSYLAGEYGGAPFVITYVLCLFLVAVPLMVAEVALGSHGRDGPVVVFRNACDRSLLSRGWMFIGVLACVTALLLLALYTVVAGWCLAYANAMQGGVFSSAPPLEVAEWFAVFLAAPERQFYWQGLFLLLTAGVVAAGVRRGLGLLVWLLVPALVAMLGFLVHYGFDNGDMAATQAFLFSVKPVDFTGESMLVALGHALFTLGVGVGTGISYGAYAPDRLPIGRSVMAVAVFDTMIALLAGLAIFPVVFANNLEPAAGPGLMFLNLPYAFGNIPQGEVAGTAFFLFVAVAALGSAVAVMEPVVASLMQFLRCARLTAVLLVSAAVCGLCWLVDASLAQTAAGDAPGAGGWFQRLDTLVAQALLPLSALLTALFVGWKMRREIARLELARESGIFFSLWRFQLRYIAPLAIIVFLLASIGAS